MGHDRIAGVAYQADHLAKVNFLSTVHLNAARLHVGVEGIAVTAEIENDVVAVSLIQRDVGGVATRCLLRLSVDDGDDESISNRQDRLAKDGVTFELFARAGIDSSAGIGLLPVHRVPLCDPYAAVDGESCAGVACGVAAGVR